MSQDEANLVHCFDLCAVIICSIMVKQQKDTENVAYAIDKSQIHKVGLKWLRPRCLTFCSKQVPITLKQCFSQRRDCQ